MKLVMAVVLALGALMVIAVFDNNQARKEKAPVLFGCRAPTAEGEITQITIDVRAGQLFGECQYASTRPSKPKKGG